jgi:hypothetical protein
MTRKEGERGQAMIETAIFLPLFLLVMYGVWWVIQTTVLSERAQVAVRYSALVSNQADPYEQFSLYELYKNAGALQPVSATCIAPDNSAFTNSGAFPGPVTPSFWQPTSTTGLCTPATSSISGAGANVLFRSTQATVSATQAVPPLVSAAIGGNTDTVQAQETFVNTPDITTVMNCFPTFTSAITDSLDDNAPKGAAGIPAPLPLVNPPAALASTC